jgi:hypothetical protein
MQYNPSGYNKIFIPIKLVKFSRLKFPKSLINKIHRRLYSGQRQQPPTYFKIPSQAITRLISHHTLRSCLIRQLTELKVNNLLNKFNHPNHHILLQVRTTHTPIHYAGTIYINFAKLVRYACLLFLNSGISF